MRGVSILNMLKTGLEFAPGTTDECKKLIARLFQPGEILGAYRAARVNFKTGDLVMRASEQDPAGFEAETRVEYVKRVKQSTRSNSLPLLMRGLDRSAHAIVQLPFQEDAMWFIVVRGPQAVPVMCVLFAAPYEVTAADQSVATADPN